MDFGITWVDLALENTNPLIYQKINEKKNKVRKRYF